MKNIILSASVNINNIISQVKKLDKEDQLNLMQRLVLILKKQEASKDSPVHLSSLSGLGNEIWQKIDIDNYIEDERQW